MDEILIYYLTLVYGVCTIAPTNYLHIMVTYCVLTY